MVTDHGHISFVLRAGGASTDIRPPITSQARGLAVEVSLLDEDETGLDRPSVINVDGLHTVRQIVLTTKAGGVSDRTLRRACEAVALALGR